ncbi:conjugal transfer protein [Streptomyces sp. PU-14G]|uniref:conjugal transfer protein n=1 Tax=Streptomyces sp. PU-14G TaxID=2800808 RepID=UPI0034DFADC8
MTTPPYGNTPPPNSSGDRSPYDPLPGQRRPELTEDMLIARQPQEEKSGWFRNRLKKKQRPSTTQANPWVSAAPHRSARPHQEPQASQFGQHQGMGHAQGAEHRLETSRGQKDEKKRDKKPAKAREQTPVESTSGNGWFRNPFAKSARNSSTDKGAVPASQMWAGPRRGILVRRLLGLVAVMVLLYLSVGLNGKADQGEVEGLVRKATKPAKTVFPEGDAVMWAAPLVKAFATYDGDKSDKRLQALKPYAINGLDSQLGWNGQGKQAVLDMVMGADVKVLSDNRAVVRSTVQIQDGSWRCVSVPVYAVERGDSTAFGLSAAPVYTPCAGLTTPPPPRKTLKNDEGLASMFQKELLAPFMAAWVQSDTDNLKRYLLPGTTSFGLGGAYAGEGEDTSPKIDTVVVPEPEKGESPDRRTVIFDVTLTSVDGEATQESQYQVQVAKKDGQWYFASDPVPVVGAENVGGEQVPEAEPSTGTGDMYEDGSSSAPHTDGSATGVQQPHN